ncbi:hypothetical protein AcW1_009898 [Taiwanofungus camphoratus]|nr:hypothetical protein AcW1_009898 [Antrodia cinnamomea]
MYYVFFGRMKVLTQALAATFLFLSTVRGGNTTCIGNGLDWYTDAVGETPCMTYQRLRQICNADYQVPSFRPNTPGDNCDDQLQACCCNSVSWALSMLCMNCQQDTNGGNVNGIDAGVGAYSMYRMSSSTTWCTPGTNQSLPADVQSAVCNEGIRLDDFLYVLFWNDGTWFYTYTRETAQEDQVSNANNTFTHCANQIVSLTSSTPASTAPASTAPASTAPASTAPASTAPASTAPASTAPSSNAPASNASASKAPASNTPASIATTSDAANSASSTASASNSASKATTSSATASNASAFKTAASTAASTAAGSSSDRSGQSSPALLQSISATQTHHQDSSSDTGAIAGGAVGGVLGFAGIVLGALFLSRRLRGRQPTRAAVAVEPFDATQSRGGWSGASHVGAVTKRPFRDVSYISLHHDSGLPETPVAMLQSSSALVTSVDPPLSEETAVAPNHVRWVVPPFSEEALGQEEGASISRSSSGTLPPPYY